MSCQGDLIHLADVVAYATAATPGKTFIHKTFEGSTPIVFRLRNKASEGSVKENAPPAHQASYRTRHSQVSSANREGEVLCSKRFVQDITIDHLTLEWIQDLGKIFSLKTERAYSSTSTIKICRMPLRIWTRLEGTNGFGYIAPVFGQDIIRK